MYVENTNQNNFFFYIPFPAAKNLLHFRGRRITIQSRYALKENPLTTNIRLKLRNMKWNCKHCLDIDCVLPEHAKDIPPWIPSRYLKWGIWIPLPAAADTDQIIIPTPKSKYIGKQKSNYTLKKCESQVHLHWSGATNPHPLSARKFHLIWINCIYSLKTSSSRHWMLLCPC